MDGFLDTCDARASWGDREKKLQILKDTHAGAFAVTGGGLYLLLYCGGCSELPVRGAAAVSAGFVLSRALSGLAAAVFPGAREHGMLADFMKPLRGGGGPWGRPGIFILKADGVPGVRRRHRGPGRVFFTAL